MSNSTIAISFFFMNAVELHQLFEVWTSVSVECNNIPYLYFHSGIS